MKYLVKYTEVESKQVCLEADSAKEARRMIYDGEFTPEKRYSYYEIDVDEIIELKPEEE